MRVFEVNVPPATLLRAVIKHIINQPPQNSLPRFKTHSCKASLSKKEQDNPFNSTIALFLIVVHVDDWLNIY